MPVKIRLAKKGRKKLALYDIVVADSRSPRDGKFIEKLGNLNPNTHPATVVLNDDKALKWILNGAQPTDTVRTVLSERGILLRKHLQVGVNKGAITQEAADKKFEDWKNEKEKIADLSKEDLAKKKDVARKERLAVEAQVNAARKEALETKRIAAELALNPPAAEVEATPEAEAPATEETSTPAAEETSATPQE